VGLPPISPHRTKDGGVPSEPIALALVAATAIRVAVAHATTAGRARLLMSGRVAGSARLASPTAVLLHLMSRRVARGAGLAGRRAAILHLLTGRAVLHPLSRALGVTKRARGEQHTRRCGDVS
jgi:hypothetical protein